MLQCLIAGKLTKPPARRTSSSGSGYVTACVLAQAGKDESYIVNVVAFADAACDALIALQAGDGVSVAGTFKPSSWTKEGGEIGVSVSVVANAVLTIADAKAPAMDGTARRGQAQPRPAQSPPAQHSPRPSGHRQQAPRPTAQAEDYPVFDDEIPF